MKLTYVELAGFRGFKGRIRIDFADAFTIIDGRNGVGKSTLFDAVEFAFTGVISKYRDATADRETVDNYIWWQGKDHSDSERFVEVGYSDGSVTNSVRRTPTSVPNQDQLKEIAAHLCHLAIAPEEPVRQLCNATILRDEHIASLSLDLKESERYALVHNALGSSDADEWIDRANRVLKITKTGVQEAIAESTSAADRLAAVVRKLDEVRGHLTRHESVAKAVSRLQVFANSGLPVEQIGAVARSTLKDRLGERESLAELLSVWRDIQDLQERIDNLGVLIDREASERKKAEDALLSLLQNASVNDFTDTSEDFANDWATLFTIGQKLGLQGEECPLCASHMSPEEFHRGMGRVAEKIEQLQEAAIEVARYRHAVDSERNIMEQSRLNESQLKVQAESALRTMERFRAIAVRANVSLVHANREEIQARLNDLDALVSRVGEDLRQVEAWEAGLAINDLVRDEEEARKIYLEAEQQLTRVRHAELMAQSLYDTARRAAAEVVNQRLERVLPLMSELYRRLRPHPTWSAIDYRIRGDVRRFLRLQVGDDLNPQFMFSSGQRRATGLAFLLAVNLSLAWSRLEAVLLDDPVQHIDDYRSIQLTEVLAEICRSGRQVICAVEDQSLADMMSRRLPVSSLGSGRRVSLGYTRDGTLDVLSDVALRPLESRALVDSPISATG